MVDNDMVYEYCYLWLEERVFVNVMLYDVNGQFQVRNIGGIVFVFLFCIVGVFGNFYVLLVFFCYYK